MAGLLTHEWIANLVLKKLSKRNFISEYENIDDYFFGAIAPDIRYINNTPKETTHKPKGEKSIFEAIKASSTSMPFIVGYETHIKQLIDKNTNLSAYLKEFKKTSIENCIQRLEEYL